MKYPALMCALTRAEGRCIKCFHFVELRELKGVCDDYDVYLCHNCGGKDVRLPRRSLWQWLGSLVVIRGRK